MDDILASIRRILNEDEQAAATVVASPAATPSASKPPAAPSAAIQLTPEMMIAPPESLAGPVAATPAPIAIAPAPTRIQESPPVSAAEPGPRAAPQPPQPEPFLMSLEPQDPPSSGLVDPTAAAAAASAFGQLSRLAQDRGAAVTRQGPSIEDLVREELRPMLKAWLDAHLPATVERLVRAEIERVMSRQG
ncbi:DUF2497 domain-containing protein [Roseococcus sp. SYP-B2431]|uniref:DUF2497 domain-containing protein n=1 Tax=Roseococcus sp. SYP-B2431 TaxID=2496640 RepID=UPI00103BD768|nr:DUF2497 domain-containing protein [Roseococcus sp. SYP-B2431]TCI00007.1 DUF2497 domain-containing protein [Roseococcus sp. SYP-B2431]